MLSKSQELGELYNKLCPLLPSLAISKCPSGVLNYNPDHRPELMDWFIDLDTDDVVAKESCPYYEAVLIQNCLELLPYCYWADEGANFPLMVIRSTDNDQIVGLASYLSLALMRAVAQEVKVIV